MDRHVWVIESSDGFLKDIGIYTTDIEKAVVFSCLQSAVDKFMSLSGTLSSDCWINRVPLSFPRQQPYISIHNK
jgi:hypothetical protein